MVSKSESFLIDLVVLLDRYDADFHYTTDDDGVHFIFEGKNPTPRFRGRAALKEWLEAAD